MGRARIFFLACFLAISFGIPNPGIKTTVLQSGIDQLLDDVVPIVEEELMLRGYPYYYHQGSHLRFNLTNIQFNYIAINEYTANITETGFVFDFSDIMFSINFDFKYVFKFLLIPYKGSGKGTATVSGASARGNVIFDLNSQGNPNTTIDDCVVKIQKLKIHLSDGIGAWLYDMFGWMFNSSTKKDIEEDVEYDLSVILADKINEMIAAYIRSTYQVTKDTQIDFGFVYKNYVPNTYMANGENMYFVPLNNPHLVPPYSPVIMPDIIGSTMLQMMISSAPMNSIGWAYYEAGALDMTISYLEAPELNTNSFVVIAPGLYKKYPNMNMSVNAWATQAPSVSIDPSGVTLDIWSLLEFNVLDNGIWIDSVFALNMYLTLEGTAYISQNINDTALSFNFSTFTTKLTVNSSSVGLILTSTLTTIINTYVRNFVLPEINNVGANGIPLPGLEYLKLQQPQLVMENEYIYMATNFSLEANTVENVFTASLHDTQIE